MILFCVLHLYVLVISASEPEDGRTESGVVNEVVNVKSVFAKGGVSTSLLTIVPNASNKSTILFMGNKNYSMGVDSLGNFSFNAQNTPMFIIDNNQTISMHMPTFSAKNVELGGDLIVQGVTQFRMIWREDFSEAKGWNGTVEKIGVSSCSGVQMLGGFNVFSRGHVQKTFIELPSHKELRIRANFHFIDRWVGETGFMKLSMSDGLMEYVWTDRHFHQETSNINICGDETGDDKFSVPIDVTIQHDSERFTILFGSTLIGNASKQSWGVSGLEVHIR
ncbi:hypothetical protein MACJ_003752 [Theileria orientalis]|uniref:Uncharacterized protein n=1 Tax=Theileria orientalis TaxID=68886 RepID=A0A976SKI0_THEOR|nr:hypothetical protein MACJ_003752 [Theileria orientalis]